MIKPLILLATLGLLHASSLKEPHPDCPADKHYLLPHEYDCTKFYYCEGGEKFIEPRNCARGTEFSFELQVCTHPFAANCNLQGYPPSSTTTTTPEPTTTTTTPEPTTTTTTPEPTTTTTTPEPTTTTTTPEPTTTTTTPELTTTTTTPEPTTTTTTPEPTTTTTTPEPTTTTITTTPVPTTTTTPVPTTTSSTTIITQAPITNPTDSPTTNTDNGLGTGTTDCERFPNGCPVDFTINQLLPHETSCRKFYQCDNGEKYLRRCPKNTVFNSLLQVCDHPFNVDRSCEDEDSSEETTTAPDDNDDQYQDLEFMENGCPVNMSINWHLPHEHYCNKFYQCVWGQKVVRICPAGTYFNQTLQVCDHIANVNCNLPGGNYVPTTTSTPPTQVPTTPPPMDFDDNGCPLDQTLEWRLPHQNCSLFYVCVWGNLVVSNCPGNLHFNPTLQLCYNPATAGCANGPCNGVNVPCPGTTEGPGDEPTEGPTESPGDAITEGTTEGPGDEPTVGPTESPGDAITEGTTEGPDDENDGGEEDPPPGDDGPNDGGNDCGSNNGNGCDGGENDSTTPDDGNPPSDDATELPPACNDNPDCIFEQDRKCLEECHIFPWAHEDCDKFWLCYGNKAMLGVCSNGLYFNPSTSTCDFACNVDCDNGKVRITPNNDGLKLHIPWNRLDDNARQLLQLITDRRSQYSIV